MTPHILTHNYYAITSLVVLTIGSFYICNQVYTRWLSQLNVSLMDTNGLIKGLVVAFGFTIVSWRSLLDANFETQSLSIIIGVVIGLIVAMIEMYILRHARTIAFSKILQNSTSSNSIKDILSRTQSIKLKQEFASYHSTAIVGACEEILYRGFMTILCMNLLNTYASIFCLLLLTIFFALSHLSLGSVHVLSKFILGSICLLAFLYTKTIITPILIHVTFNTIAVNKFRRLAYE
jgi:membrane protease YdiL (CAAX protease family)